jgi:co-chaperonin GroES (HSP10)
MKTNTHRIPQPGLNPEAKAQIAEIAEMARNARSVALPKAYEEDFSVDWTKKGRLPKPHFIPNGKRIVILQEPEERISKGGILIPDQSATKYRPTVGVVIGLGTGYDPEHPLWDEWERSEEELLTPPWRCPFKVGDRVVWGRYHGDVRVKTTVEPEWFDEGEDPEEGVPVIIIHVKDVLGFAGGLKIDALRSEIDELNGSPQEEEPE